jgi:hypothetical protein
MLERINSTLSGILSRKCGGISGRRQATKVIPLHHTTKALEKRWKHVVTYAY